MIVAVREAFGTAYPDKEVLNNTTKHRPATKLRDTGSVCDRKDVRPRAVPVGEAFRSMLTVLKAASIFTTGVFLESW
jgi:hypothetical protein